MIIIPAIDLKDGCVVRLVQGKRDQKTYSRDPVKTAKHWVRQGARLIHVIDLDGAFSGKQKNFSALKDILRATNVPLQFGGGVRSIETIKELIGLGVQRVVLGTKAIEEPKFLRRAFAGFKDKVIVSIDTRDNRLLVKGWQAAHKAISIVDFIRLLKEVGFQRLIYTDVTKDGTLKGPNIKDLKNLLKTSGMKIISSGGISSLEDIQRLKLLEKQGLEGIIVGKALYEGKFTLTQALSAV